MFILAFLCGFVVPNVTLYFLGRFLFSCGKYVIGHRFVAMSIAGDFGLFKNVRKWLVDNCPFSNCSTCRLWTCPNYKNSKSV